MVYALKPTQYHYNIQQYEADTYMLIIYYMVSTVSAFSAFQFPENLLNTASGV